MGYMDDFISLAEWAKLHNIDYFTAKNWARIGRLKGLVEKRIVPVKRLAISKSITPDSVDPKLKA